MSGKEPKPLSDQLKTLFPEAASNSAPSPVGPAKRSPKPFNANKNTEALLPKAVVRVDFDEKTGLVTLRKVSREVNVTSEAQLYHMAAKRMVKEGTDSLWFARTPARSPRGDLWMLHNPRALQILVDPLALCRSAADEFNRRGRVELWCYPSRQEYLAPSGEAAVYSRVQPVVSTDDESERAPEAIQKPVPSEEAAVVELPPADAS